MNITHKLDVIDEEGVKYKYLLSLIEGEEELLREALKKRKSTFLLYGYIPLVFDLETLAEEELCLPSLEDYLSKKAGS